MSVKQTIEDKIQRALSPDHLEVINESHMHSVPPNSETHFKLVIVTSAFEGQRQVQRHQQVYRLLGDELDAGVHALALHTYLPGEWAARAQAPDSPQCLGGGKSG
ncbi:BolA family protein [Porticoccus litoralis]|jgi:BolA protein|uniref:DNA-binding transcriptional regulator BolA n=1 Tax=Porticoccus litoralis TaxID=434086 RepID=A0AAW8B1F3_9GAMM|nr:BolA/IbaG family iron-sulfur metabolism protein [Porticoccus litoralis]MDP1519440.1 BolA/IbaG family iron-sulfur metabolism protein [Porticoccus litoralis]TNE93083.1 MAG: BolA/IbaG family iron-sulfur metabolism protein [Gammaproteobacteria bacterium]